MVNSIEIEYLTPKNEFRVGNAKNIAIPSNNKDDIKKSYNVVPTVEIQSNADMLSQSFSAEPQAISPQPSQETSQQPIIEPILEQSQEIVQAQEPVHISSIPTIQSSNLESTPVSLDMNSTPVPEMPVIEPIVEPTLNVNNSVETNLSMPTVDIPNVQNNIGIDSGFKVSNEPNIFDNPTPFGVNETDLNKPIENNNNDNIFSIPTFIPKEENVVESNQIIAGNENKIISTSINDDIIQAEIAIEENNVKHYEALAENSRKKVELLKRQIKNEKKEDVNLENTASNLFNNNGVLDDEKVLGKTPMPNIMAA